MNDKEFLLEEHRLRSSKQSGASAYVGKPADFAHIEAVRRLAPCWQLPNETAPQKR